MKPRDAYAYWGGQRYVLVLLITFLCSFLLWQGKLISADFAFIMVSVVGVYITGRTYQNIKVGKDE
jgi:Ca2+-dependent lipid-binding protein